MEVEKDEKINSNNFDSGVQKNTSKSIKIFGLQEVAEQSTNDNTGKEIKFLTRKIKQRGRKHKSENNRYHDQFDDDNVNVRNLVFIPLLIRDSVNEELKNDFGDQHDKKFLALASQIKKRSHSAYAALFKKKIKDLLSSGKYKSCETKNKKLIDYLYNIYIKENKYSKYIELFEMSIQEFVGYFSPFVKVPNLNEVDNAKDNKNCNIIESITQKVNVKLENYLGKDQTDFNFKFKKNLLDFPSIIEDILKKGENGKLSNPNDKADWVLYWWKK